MSKKVRIMVVDDEIITIKTCEFILQKNDYDVVSATSGLRCLNYLRNPQNPPVDLILLDIEMPMLNGYNTLSSIRQSKALKHIPVVFLTATATPETVKEAVRLGVNSYLKKPFLPQALLDRVEQVLSENAAENHMCSEDENEGWDIYEQVKANMPESVNGKKPGFKEKSAEKPEDAAAGSKEDTEADTEADGKEGTEADSKADTAADSKENAGADGREDTASDGKADPDEK